MGERPCSGIRVLLPILNKPGTVLDMNYDVVNPANGILLQVSIDYKGAVRAVSPDCARGAQLPVAYLS